MLKLSDLAVSVGDFELGGINLEIGAGEYFVILGASGAGKTVLLETLAGRHCLKHGRIEMDGREISSLPPERRNIGFVYQNYELFPHMTVEQNIAFGLRYKGLSGNERRRKALEMMEVLSIANLKDCYTDALSGGKSSGRRWHGRLWCRRRFCCWTSP
jgi:ABC-type sugar transport system ATPase subunit